MIQQLEQIKPIDIQKIADDLEVKGELQMYWDYRDTLSEEQIIKILTEEEGLINVEMDIWENNSDFVGERVRNLDLKELGLTEEQEEELIQECESRFNLNIDGLIKNSQINIRVELLSNEDMICFVDNQYKGSETIKEFKRVFRSKYKKEDLNKEINNAGDYALFCFYFRVRGLDILKLREQILKGFITLRKGLQFGFFNSWVGSGSVLEIELLKEIKLNLKDWRIKNNKEAIIKGLKEGTKSYYGVSIKSDNLNKYGLQTTYGLSSW